jgi:uncharacterized protein (DUF58 family)
MTEDVGLHLTEEGRTVVLGCGVLATVVFATGNNLLAILLAMGLALVCVSAPLAALNLRGVEVRRKLPDELFQGRGCHGWWVLRNQRSIMVARAISVNEQQGGERVRLASASPGGGTSRTAAVWRFETRGLVPLGGLMLSSTFPFGLWRADLVIDQPVEVLVYPRPRWGHGETAVAWMGERIGHHAAPGGVGDLLGLREYRPGDRLASIHWGVSARRDQPMVVLRSGEVGRAVCVTIPLSPDEPGWEQALSRGCGDILDAFRQGFAVGLVLGEDVHPPGLGGAWRRRLLGVLGTAPPAREGTW